MDTGLNRILPSFGFRARQSLNRGLSFSRKEFLFENKGDNPTEFNLWNKWLFRPNIYSIQVEKNTTILRGVTDSPFITAKSGTIPFVAGYIDKGISFNGTSATIFMATTPMDVVSTVCFWFLPTSGTTQQGLFGSAGLDYGIYYNYNNIAEDIAIRVLDANTSANIEIISSGHALNTWVHIACVLTPTSISLYINATLVSTEILDGVGIQGIADAVFINIPTIGEYIRGTIDNFNVFRQTKTAGELNTIRNNEYPLPSSVADGIVVSNNFNSRYYNSIRLDLYKGSSIPLDKGTFTKTGIPLGLFRNINITLNTGNYIFTGNNLNFSKTYVLTAETGSYIYNGIAVGTLANKGIFLNNSTFNLIGIDVLLKRGLMISVAKGDFTLAPFDVNFQRSYVANINTGNFTLNGNIINLLKQSLLNIETGEYLLNGNPIDLIEFSPNNANLFLTF